MEGRRRRMVRDYYLPPSLTLLLYHYIVVLDLTETKLGQQQQSRGANHHCLPNRMSSGDSFQDYVANSDLQPRLSLLLLYKGRGWVLFANLLPALFYTIIAHTLGLPFLAQTIITAHHYYSIKSLSRKLSLQPRLVHSSVHSNR